MSYEAGNMVFLLLENCMFYTINEFFLYLSFRASQVYNI